MVIFSKGVGNMKFADKLKNLLVEKDMSQSELAIKTGIPKAFISSYLFDKNGPSDDAILKIAEALDVDTSYFTPKKLQKKDSKKITVKEAASQLGKSEMYVRIGLQRGFLVFGTAVKMSSKWSYHISPKLLQEYIGA